MSTETTHQTEPDSSATSPATSPTASPEAPALTLATFDASSPGAPVLRDTDPDSEESYRKRDRRPVIRYGRRPATPARERFTPAERWIINRDGQRTGNDFYLLGTIPDDDAHTQAMATRGSLRKLLAIALFCGADILLEANHPNRDVLALLGHFADRSGHRVILSGAASTNPHRPGRPVARSRYTKAAANTYAGWRAQADEHTSCTALEMLVLDAGLDMGTTGGYKDKQCYTGELLGCADQPLRHPALAAVVDRHLRGYGWHDRDIREYLSLHGFVNGKGGLGIWHHVNLEDLRAQPNAPRTGAPR